MTRQNRKLQLFILLTLVCLVGTMSIAYAILSTTLNINGTAQVQDASWNVHFDNVQVNPYSVEINPVITDNNKVSFSADLTTPGDFYKFTVDIVNEGSIDAMIESIIKTPELTVEQSKYVRYEVEYVDGTSINDSQLLKSGETKTISILFSYRNDIPTSDLPSSETEFDLEIVLVYVQADTTGTEISGTDSVIKVANGDLNTVGSEICIGKECFYLMSNDGYKITMFAKYNLYAGNKCTSSTACVRYGEEATGIQDSSMTGYQSDGGYPRDGSTEYSSDTQHGENYNDYGGSIVEKYVNNYKQYLLLHNITIEEARLIKVDELQKLGCTSYNCADAPEWIYSVSYWTQTKKGEDLIFDVNSSTKTITNNYYYSAHLFGVRPVIEIPLTEF